MPEFTELIKQYVHQERTWGELDSLVISPDLEQFVRKIVREETSKVMDEIVRRLRTYGGGYIVPRGEDIEVK